MCKKSQKQVQNEINSRFPFITLLNEYTGANNQSELLF